MTKKEAQTKRKVIDKLNKASIALDNAVNACEKAEENDSLIEMLSNYIASITHEVHTIAASTEHVEE